MGQAGLEQPCDCPVQQQDSRASAVRTKGVEEQPGNRAIKEEQARFQRGRDWGQEISERGNKRHSLKLESQASCYKFRKTNFI